MNERPKLDLRVGDEVLVSQNYGPREHTPGKVTAVKRVYATVAETGLWYLDGEYRLDNGAKRGGSAWLTTQARVDWDNEVAAAHKTIQDAGLHYFGGLVSTGLMLALAEFLRGVDKDGEPVD